MRSLRRIVPLPAAGFSLLPPDTQAKKGPVAVRDFHPDLARLAERGILRLRLDSPGPGTDYSSNDYLGFARDPRVSAALAQAAATQGTGAGAARLLTGAHPLHRYLEQRLAALVGLPDALLFNTGYCANIGLLPAIAGPEDAIFSDALNHASLIDGCRLSRAAVFVYPHCQPAHLEALLLARPARRRVIVTESVFGMEGDLAPLADLRSLADRHGAMLVVDEAHSLGLMGAQGAGACAAAGIVPDALVGTLGKALGTFGAFVAGTTDLVAWLCNQARSFLFTTAPPPALSAAATHAVDLAAGPEGTQRRALLAQHRARVAAALRALAVPIPACDAPILPIHLGSPAAALQAATLLRNRGVLALPIRPPTVPEGTSRLRISLSAAHSDVEIDRLIGALTDLRSLL